MPSRVPTGTESPGNTPGGVSIGSYAELLKHEKEIVDRINNRPNGGLLFLAHPFELLNDLGYSLGPEARAEIVKLHPELQSLSVQTYRKMRGINDRMNPTVRIQGLFRREAKR